MHIGSAASPKMNGALHFGGYDQNRVVGGVLTSPGDYNRETTLRDIAIKVVDSASPWSFGAVQDGLLAQGNASMASQGVYVHIDGCSPCLSLPPVHVRRHGAPPARHLRGRARPVHVERRRHQVLADRQLRDAFVGANWGAKTWFMAKAPGPNIPPSNVVKYAGSDAKAIEASKNDWKESWSGSRKNLTPAEAGGSTALAAPNNTNPIHNSNKTEGGLSTGGKAGIGVGIGVGALAVIAAGAFLWSRRQRVKNGDINNNNNSYNPSVGAPPSQGYYKPDGSGPYNPSTHDSSVGSAIYSTK
ncbi:hypothetical protein PG994_006674 [Apiospora phragmitis]|uniref:Uncharacterized protein n=1 Tax=Apiospora phragmitis TaxID=2905665 RepID=A0ABR1VFS9_9PEZI